MFFPVHRIYWTHTERHMLEVISIILPTGTVCFSCFMNSVNQSYDCNTEYTHTHTHTQTNTDVMYHSTDISAFLQ